MLRSGAAKNSWLHPFPSATKTQRRPQMKLPALLGLLAATVVTDASASDVVRLGNLKFAHYGAVSYMKEVCGKYGIKIDERMFAKGPDILPAIVANEIDIAALASDGAVSGRANGVPIYTVAGFAKGGARIVAHADSGIRTLRDLKNKKVGVTRGGMQELLLLAELDKEGMTWSDKPGKDVHLVYLGFADLNQALSSRGIDAMCQSEPQSSQAINRKFGVEVMKPYNTSLGEPYRVLVMTEKMYRDNPGLALRTMQCFVDATAQFRKDPALAERYVREQMFRNQLTQQDFRDAMDNAAYTYDITFEHIDTVTGLMQKFGVGRMTRPPKATDWVKLDLLRQAKANQSVD